MPRPPRRPDRPAAARARSGELPAHLRPHRARPYRPGQETTEANVASEVAALLAGFGIGTTEVRDTVEDVVAAELAARGYRAGVLELRWGVLRLVADAHTAALLRFDIDNLLAALAERTPGQVTSIVVRVGALPRSGGDLAGDARDEDLAG